MKKQLLILSTAAFVFCGSSFASAQHCTVQSGDSMWKIAERYKIPFEEILRHNAHFKNPHLIFPLDKIELPDHTQHGTTTNEHSASDNIPHGENKVEQSAPSEQAEAVLKLVNAERAKAGLKALKMSEELRSIANLKSRDMGEKGYFDHNSPTYGSPFKMLQDFGVHEVKLANIVIAAKQAARFTLLSALEKPKAQPPEKSFHSRSPRASSIA